MTYNRVYLTYEDESHESCGSTVNLVVRLSATNQVVGVIIMSLHDNGSVELRNSATADTALFAHIDSVDMMLAQILSMAGWELDRPSSPYYVTEWGFKPLNIDIFGDFAPTDEDFDDLLDFLLDTDCAEAFIDETSWTDAIDAVETYADLEDIREVDVDYTENYTAEPTAGGHSIVVTLQCNVCGSMDNWKPEYDAEGELIAFCCDHSPNDMHELAMPIRRVCTVSTYLSDATGRPRGTYLFGKIDVL